MPGIPFKYADTFRLLRRATEQLHELMASGEFYTYGYLKRRALLRRVRKLYNRLSGPVSPALLRGAALAAGALALAGCTPPTDPIDDPAVTQTPNFAAVQINPFGIDDSDPSLRQYHRSPILLGDIDGDGDLDLLYTTSSGEGGDYIVVQRGNGTGFGAVEVEPFGLTRNGWSMDSDWYYKPLHLIDVDGDGRLDLIGLGYVGEFDQEFSSYHEGLIFVRNTGSIGSPSFADPVPLGPSGVLPSSYYVRAMAFVDIDGDGDLDLITATRYNLYLTANTSQSAALADFTAESYVPFPYPSVFFPDDFRINGIAIVDLDKDGDLDLLVSGYTATYDEGFGGSITEPMLIYFQNTSTAAGFSFASGQVNPFGISFPARQWAEWDYYYSYWYNRSTPLGLAVGDLDGDGDLDLLMGVNVEYDFDTYSHLSEFFYFENRAIP